MKYNVAQLKVGTKFMLTGEIWNRFFIDIPSIVTRVNEESQKIEHYYLKDILDINDNIILRTGKIDTTCFSELEINGFRLLDRKNTKPDWL